MTDDSTASNSPQVRRAPRPPCRSFSKILTSKILTEFIAGNVRFSVRRFDPATGAPETDMFEAANHTLGFPSWGPALIP